MSSHSLFKFTKDGITRRVTLQANASWLDIASKIETLYSIPLETVGLSYVDDDGDEITISTQEELQDYYRSIKFAASDQLIKFTVVDLNSLRGNQDKPLPDTPRSSHLLRGMASHNTFGAVPFNYEGDDDWQRVPGFNQLFAPPTDRSRFIELSTDAGSRLNDGSRKSGSVTGSVSSTATARARLNTDDDISSIDSVIGNDTPKKPPVHVYTVSGGPTASSTSIPGPDRRSESRSSSSDAAPDPPLPDLEPPPASSANPSLTYDVANLLSSITATFSSHPELADGLRNIVRNLGNGSYFAAHREQLTNAAEQIRRSSQVLHAQMADATANSAETEQQASRRIAEAVGNIVRSLSQIAVDPAAPNATRGSDGVSPPLWWSTFGAAREPPPFSPPSDNAGAPRPPHPPHPPHPLHPPHPPHPHPHHPPHPHSPHGPPHSHVPFRGWGRPPPPHDPSGPWPLGRGWHGGPPHRMPWMGWDGPHRPPPLPSQEESTPHLDISDDDSDDAEDAEVSMYGVSQRLSPRAQKERLQTAKAAYISEKQKYRQEKQARRRERERIHHPDADITVSVDASGSVAPPVNTSSPAANPSAAESPVSVTQLISHGRGQFPPLEHFSIPRRQPVHSSTRGRHHREVSGSTNAETSRVRITRRLSDMGFNDPSIARRVSIHVPDDVVREKSAEDTIVSNVVEELLTESANPVDAPETTTADRRE